MNPLFREIVARMLRMLWLPGSIFALGLGHRVFAAGIVFVIAAILILILVFPPKFLIDYSSSEKHAIELLENRTENSEAIFTKLDGLEKALKHLYANPQQLEEARDLLDLSKGSGDEIIKEDSIKSAEENKDQSEKLYYASQLALSEKDLSEAEELLSKSLKYDPKNVRAIIQLAAIEWEKSNLDSALSLFKDAESFCKSPKDTESMAIALNGMGVILNRKGETSRAQLALEKSRNIYQELGKIEKLLNTKQNLSQVYARQGLVFKAKKELEESVEIADANGIRTFQARGEVMIAELLSSHWESDEAIGYARQAMEIKEIEPLYLARSLKLIGQTQGNQGDTQLGIQNLERALEIFRALGRPIEVATIEDAIARNLNWVLEFDRAEELFLNSLQFFREHGPDKERLAVELHLLDLKRDRVRTPKKRLEELSRIAVEAKNNSFPAHEAEAYTQLAYLCSKHLKNDDLSIEYLNDAIGIAKDYDLNGILSKSYKGLAEIHAVGKKEYKKAIQYYEKLLRLQEKVGNERNQAEIHEHLYLNYLRSDDKRQAIFHLKKSIFLFESIDPEVSRVLKSKLGKLE